VGYDWKSRSRRRKRQGRYKDKATCSFELDVLLVKYGSTSEWDRECRARQRMAER
jgi:hypothetical protein